MLEQTDRLSCPINEHRKTPARALTVNRRIHQRLRNPSISRTGDGVTKPLINGSSNKTRTKPLIIGSSGSTRTDQQDS